MTDGEQTTPTARPLITPEPNGALLLSDVLVLTNSKGDAIRVTKGMRLCRCGAAKTKPLCDNTHESISFASVATDERVPDNAKTFVGKDITIHDNRGICSHAGFCTAELYSVFSFPDIKPDAASVEEIKATIARCPSGALSYTLGDELVRDREARPEIHISKNGPYEVYGRIGLADTEFMGNASKEHYTLCRCGKSRGKPFCDGTHWYADFQDHETRTILQKVTGEKPKLVWHRVVGKDDLAVGEVRQVLASSLAIALAKTEDGYHALANRCTHQGGPLGDGALDGACVRCPWHGWAFDLASGANTEGGGDPVATYQVEERDAGIYVGIDEDPRAAQTVSDILAHTMVNWGITHVFGMVGHSNLGMAEAIRKRVEAGELTYIGIRHEGAAAFACSGYAKLTGNPAACLAIAGPGGTNLLTGLWDAKVDRAPVLALTGQVDTQVLGPGAFQEIDVASAFAAVTCYSQTVLPGSDHGELMSLAIKTAIIKRDVAHLILPNEVQTLPVPKDARIGDPPGRVSSTDIEPAADGLRDAMYRFWRTKRPVIIVGYGARDDMDAVIDLAEGLGCPILTTFKAKGVIPDSHPLAGGVLGRSGTPVASHFMAKADLLLVFGASFSAHTGIEADKPIIQVDSDRMALGKFHRVASPVWGDVGKTSQAMLKNLPAGPFEDQRGEIAERWAMWRTEKSRRAAIDRQAGLNSALIFQTLAEVVPEDAIIPVDVGNNTYSFGRYFECKKQTILMSGYLGSIGFAFPAAMGAWAGAKNRKVVSISGDGGFGQYMGEFTTAVKYDMDITHVLINNGELGKISTEQRAGGWPIWQTELHNLDFSQYAILCGGLGIRVTKAEDLEEALKKAIGHKGPALVEIMADASLI